MSTQERHRAAAVRRPRRKRIARLRRCRAPARRRHAPRARRRTSPAPSQPVAPAKSGKPKKQRAQKSSPPLAAAPSSVPPRVTLHVWEPERANRFDPEETIEAAMGEVLAADARCASRRWPRSLSPPAAAGAALADADKALADAKQAYADMDLDKAKPLLETALKSYQKFMPELAARPDGIAPMRDGFIELANVRFFEGNQEGARDALRYVFVLDGSVHFDKAMFPGADEEARRRSAPALRDARDVDGWSSTPIRRARRSGSTASSCPIARRRSRSTRPTAPTSSATRGAATRR